MGDFKPRIAKNADGSYTKLYITTKSIKDNNFMIRYYQYLNNKISKSEPLNIAYMPTVRYSNIILN